MTDTLTELDPEALRRELARLFAEPKSLHHIASAGLDGVRRQLAQLSEAITTAATGADQVVDTVKELCNLIRQEQRKHAGAVRQAQKEHARAEQLAAEVEQLRQAVTGAQQEGAVTGRVSRERLAAAERENARLRSELADYQLAASEQQGAAARVLCGASIGNPLDPSKLIGPCNRPAGHADPEHQAADGVKWTLLVPRTEQAAPCWCGHEPDAHVADDSDNAVCRACIDDPAVQVQRVFHTHTPNA